ncbi:MAG: FecR domain-containing protein [Candidatus Tectomicrobia bacterium]
MRRRQKNPDSIFCLHTSGGFRPGNDVQVLRRSLIVVVLLLLALPGGSWGQELERIGTVLVVDGTAFARAEESAEEERLHFRDAIFLNDIVRTEADSKVKFLLRNDTIVTLAELSEMQCTEFLLQQDKEQERAVLDLFLGKLRLITSNLFRTGSVVDIRTPNTVVGIRGTDLVVSFTPPATTDVVVLASDLPVTVQNPLFSAVETVTSDMRSRVIGRTPPTPAVPLPPGMRREVMSSVRTRRPHVPSETQTTRERAQHPLPPMPRGSGNGPPGSEPSPSPNSRPGAGPQPLSGPSGHNKSSAPPPPAHDSGPRPPHDQGPDPGLGPEPHSGPAPGPIGIPDFALQRIQESPRKERREGAMRDATQSPGSVQRRIRERNLQGPMKPPPR